MGDVREQPELWPQCAGAGPAGRGGVMLRATGRRVAG